MDSLQIVLLAIVQGVTEFLPISSSAHLILLPRLFGWADQGLVFDVAVHAGTLIAVLVYFRDEVWRMLRAWSSSLSGGEANQDSRLAWWVIIATLPAVVAGLLLQGLVETSLRSPWVIAFASIGFGLLLWYADAKSKPKRNEYQLSIKDVLIIGAMQALALIPGTSRSGITMTAALMLGLTRQSAARFSFLLAMPLIFASGVLQTSELIAADQPVAWVELLAGALLSALFAGLCIHFFLRLIDKIGMLPFVIYRVLLGIVIIALLA